MASAMSVAMSQMHLPSGIGYIVAMIVFTTGHLRFGSVIIHQRSAVFGVSLALSLFLWFDVDLCGMRTLAYTRL